MKPLGDTIRLSATDLAQHLGCRHLTALDWEAANGRLDPPIFKDPILDLLKEKGLAHEAAYAEHLEGQGLSVVECGLEGGVDRVSGLMHEGVEVIFQAPLEGDGFFGIADFLQRIEQPSRLGAWSYEVYDTKLAKETRAGTILQLSLYSELVAAIQGPTPDWMFVVKPGHDFKPERFRVLDYAAYYRLVKSRLVASVDALRADSADEVYPAPVPQCDICRWWKHCTDRRRKDDHLCLVAGMSTTHTRELQRQGVTTLEQLGDAPQPLKEKPERGSRAAFERLHDQARVQLEYRRTGEHVVELLDVQEDRGFLRLPDPSPGDVFFDIEGARFVDDGGLEYLFGWCVRGNNGELQYRGEWAFDRGAEKLAFERFVDAVMARLAADPGMHVYHFAPYEPSAAKRLMGRFATRADEIDRLLRAGRFVDLHAVAKQGVRASVESYGLKQLEDVFGFARQVDLREASAARRRLECALEFETPDLIDPVDRETVEGYNREDCESTAVLRDWLEARRDECIAGGEDLPRPVSAEGDPTEGVAGRLERVQEVYDALTEDLPEDLSADFSADREGWDEEQRARALLAEMLDYHRREMNCSHWEFFRMHDLEFEQLLDERKAIAGLTFVGEVDGGSARSPIHRYSFEAQEAAVSALDKLHEIGTAEEDLGTVFDIDAAAGTIDIKKRGRAKDVHPSCVMVDQRIAPWVKAGSLLELARSAAAHGVDGDGPNRAGRDLLLGRPPRRRHAGGGSDDGAGGSSDDGAGGKLREEDEPLLDAAVRLANELDGGLLPIQGPPGSGKTYIGARMIVDLARQGKRIGVTAVSHKVIRNLLREVLEARDEAGALVFATHKIKGGVDTMGDDGVIEVKSNPDALGAVDAGQVVGATAWLWSKDDAQEKLDYLFVDEAGQMAMADVLAVSRAARNVVLLGDPQQLEQPQQGSHPEGTDVAALVHVLGKHDVIPADKGLFFDETWRLHPSICEFTSELYYEDELESRDGLDRQALGGPTKFAGSGLFTVPVDHAGCQSSSPEEVETIVNLVDDLLQDGVTWTDGNGVTGSLEAEHILIVAPYNAQIAALKRRLPELNIGTVDKFQGQQAPVVIYSMTASSTEDAPRGMEFLFNPNRLNVATSRARCACILVASPRLFEPECRTPSQMRWANGLCRFRELALGIAAQEPASDSGTQT